MTELVAAGIVIAAALLTEFFARPWFDRRRVAAVLRVEVHADRQHLLSLEEHWKKTPGTIPPDAHFDYAVFDNLTSSVGSLRTVELVTVVELYLQLKYLERLVAKQQHEWEVSRDMQASGPRRKDAMERLNGIRHAFADSASIALDRANRAFTLLDRIPKDRLGVPGHKVRWYERTRLRSLRRRQGVPD